MTIHPADVAMALECFVDFDAKTDAWYCSFPSGKVAGDYEDEEMNYSGDDEDWQQSDGNGSDEEVEDEEEDEDDSINEDEEDEEEEGNGNDRNVDTMQNSSNTSSNNDSNSNKFDTAFPPLKKPVKALSNGEFDKTMIQPILEEMRACLPMKKGVIDVLKSAMYAFLVSKLT